MTTENQAGATVASGAYAALRHGGTPAWAARTQLGLKSSAAARLEQQFQRRAGGRGDAMKPRFARHDEHVSAIVEQGGYPALPEKRR